jgi:hypothetical protein
MKIKMEICRIEQLKNIGVSPVKRTDCHDITEILLKVALNTINLTRFLVNVIRKGTDEL